MKRTQYVIYAVVLREHPAVVKLGRTTLWSSRRREYDTWNFADADGVADCHVYCVTDEYVDLSALESACLCAMADRSPRYRGAEWFKATLADAKVVIEGVLQAGGISYVEKANPARGVAVRKFA